MRTLTTILSAGVVAGLLGYLLLEAFAEIGIMINGYLTMSILAFVLTLAGVGFGSAGLALWFRRALEREQASVVAALEQRLAQLEAQRRGAS